MFKISKLTTANVRALDETRKAHGLDVTLGATTAAFAADPATVLHGVDAALAAYPKNGHPRSSLWAVRRKVEAVATATPEAEPVKVTTKGAAKRAQEAIAAGKAPASVAKKSPAKPKVGQGRALDEKDDRKLAAAKSATQVAAAALDEALAAERKARTARSKAMAAMYAAGASYAQVAEVVGMTPMAARTAILALTS